MIRTILLTAVVATTALHGAADGGRVIRPEAAEKNHVLVVNVGGALAPDVFAEAVSLAAEKVQVNIWTNVTPTSTWARLTADPAAMEGMFGARAKICVFVEKSAAGPSFLQAPGAWAVVNVRGMDRDTPTRERYVERAAKMILKGLAHAGGSGASLDPKCAMFFGSFTLKGMDATGVQLSPAAYFPMIETLKALGGADILIP